jgi:hypothetical protein
LFVFGVRFVRLLHSETIIIMANKNGDDSIVAKDNEDGIMVTQPLTGREGDDANQRGNDDDDDDDDENAILPPCFRLPILSLLVPYFAKMLTGETQKRRSMNPIMSTAEKAMLKKNDVFFQAVDDDVEDDDDKADDALKNMALEVSNGDFGYSPSHQVSVSDSCGGLEFNKGGGCGAEEEAVEDDADVDYEADDALKNMALEVSNGDFGYSPPHQVSVGGSCDGLEFNKGGGCGAEEEGMSCSTTAEDDDDDDSSSSSLDQSPKELRRCGGCSFRISTQWRFCPECGMYIEASTVRTIPINTLNLSLLEGADVDTPKREDSFMEELVEGLE